METLPVSTCFSTPLDYSMETAAIEFRFEDKLNDRLTLGEGVSCIAIMATYRKCQFGCLLSVEGTQYEPHPGGLYLFFRRHSAGFIELE